MLPGWDWTLVEGFFLAFLRTGTAVTLMPVFGYKAVPLQIKAGLAGVLALILAPTAAHSFTAAPPGAVAIVAVAASEVLTGLIIGLFCALILMGAQFAGAILSIQIGFGMVDVMNPEFGGSTPVIGQLEYLVALVIFLALDFHHVLIDALATSFQIVPLGGAAFPGGLGMNYARLSADLFVVAIKLAAPVIGMILMAEISLGFAARMLPQMNVFIVGFPLRIGVGLIGLIISWPLFLYVLTKFFGDFEKVLTGVVALLGGR